jgi:hypothetical protein
VFEEVKEQGNKPEPELQVKPQHLSISNAIPKIQTTQQVVKVKGSITVSF